MLEKTFVPADIEARLYQQWESSGAFKPGGRPKAEAFTIVIPPLNVTGSLHMGHALNNTMQDTLMRFERMLRQQCRALAQLAARKEPANLATPGA